MRPCESGFFSDFGTTKYAELQTAIHDDDPDRAVHVLSEMSLEGSDLDAAFVDDVVTRRLVPQVAIRVYRRRR